MSPKKKIKVEKENTVRIILWFKNDLRLHDNYAINWTIEHLKKFKES